MTMRYAHHYPESLHPGVEVLDHCYNSAAIGQKEKAREFEPSSNLLDNKSRLVVGTGFEPATFGL